MVSPGIRHIFLALSGSTLTVKSCCQQSPRVKTQAKRCQHGVTWPWRSEAERWGTTVPAAGAAGKWPLFRTTNEQLSAWRKRRDCDRKPRRQGERPPVPGLLCPPCDQQSSQCARAGARAPQGQAGTAGLRITHTRCSSLLCGPGPSSARVLNTLPKSLCLSQVPSQGTSFGNCSNKTVLLKGRETSTCEGSIDWLPLTRPQWGGA